MVDDRIINKEGITVKNMTKLLTVNENKSVNTMNLLHKSQRIDAA